MFQPMYKSPILYEVNHVDSSSTVHLAAMAIRIRTSAGVMGMAGLSRHRTCTWACVERVCKEPTRATIAVSTSSNLNLFFYPMGIEWRSCMSSPTKTVCALDFKFVIEWESGDGSTHIANFRQILSHHTYRTKIEIFGWNHGFQTCHLTLCSSTYSNARSWDLAWSGGGATLDTRTVVLLLTVQDTVWKLLVSCCLLYFRFWSLLHSLIKHKMLTMVAIKEKAFSGWVTLSTCQAIKYDFVFFGWLFQLWLRCRPEKK